MANKKIVFHTEWFDVESEEYRDVPALAGKPIYRIKAPDSAIIVALTKGNEFILVRQFRPASDQETLEFPAGAIETHETPLESAVRELYEETGYVSKNIRQIGRYGITPNRTSGRAYVFFVKDAEKKQSIVPEAGCVVVEVTPSELSAMIQSGEFEQLPGIGALAVIKHIIDPAIFQGF